MTTGTIRVAEVEDAGAIAELNVSSWRATFAGLIPEDERADLPAAALLTSWTALLSAPEPNAATVVVEVAGSIVGYARFYPSQDEDDVGRGVGTVATLYLDPDHWGLGLGALLLDGVVGQLQRRDFLAATLWVLDGNHRARHLFEAHGWVQDGGAVLLGGVGDPVSKLRYRLELAAH